MQSAEVSENGSKNKKSGKNRRRVICELGMLSGIGTIFFSIVLFKYIFSANFDLSEYERQMLSCFGLIVYILCAFFHVLLDFSIRLLIRAFAVSLILISCIFAASSLSYQIVLGGLFWIGSFLTCCTISQGVFQKTGPLIEYLLFGHGKIVASQLCVFDSDSNFGCRVKSNDDLSVCETFDH